MWHRYQNGNVNVYINDEDGTKIRQTDEDEFRPEFPESMDINITQKCNAECTFCYAGCTPNGKHGDIMGAKFIDTLPNFVEVAINGNDLTHPDLVPFLEKLRDKQIFASVTVNQKHFEQKEDLIRKLVDEKLIYGLGISLVNPTQEFVDKVLQYPNAVIHTINGVTIPEDYTALSKLGKGQLKILILGYKLKGRGIPYFLKHRAYIEYRSWWLSKHIQEMLTDGFKLVSFDNLALEQLNIQDKVSTETWNQFYMGDEGSSSMFVDLVTGKFGISSLESEKNMFPLMDDVKDMFSVIQEKRRSRYGNDEQD